ncbi:MAG: D-cysteine desulfhydrase family protein [Pseudomonadota bacterium]
MIWLDKARGGWSIAVMFTHPRVTFVSEPTPLERLARLSERLGIDLWIKRDDLAGTTFGGNKARQLEFYLGAAAATHCDTVLITGAVQSNFVRTAAALAAKIGMRTIVQLEQRVPGQDALYQGSGNVILNRLLGAQIIHYPNGEDEAGADAALRARAAVERARGHRPYVIPLALGNPPLGALGYVQAAKEIMAQKDDFDVVVVASGSGLTHAGLLAGLGNSGFDGEVIGSCVRRDAVQQRARIRTVLDDLAPMIEMFAPVPDQRIDLWDEALTPGYGQAGAAALAAIEMMARDEGLILDPVYTGKVFAAIPALVNAGRIAKGSKVCFVHTGGLASVFAYQTVLERAFEQL